MDTLVFKQRLSEASKTFDGAYADQIIESVITDPTLNLRLNMEECFEIVEVLVSLSNDPSFLSWDLLQEAADIWFGLEVVKKILGLQEKEYRKYTPTKYGWLPNRIAIRKIVRYGQKLSKYIRNPKTAREGLVYAVWEVENVLDHWRTHQFANVWDRARNVILWQIEKNVKANGRYI